MGVNKYPLGMYREIDVHQGPNVRTMHYNRDDVLKALRENRDRHKEEVKKAKSAFLGALKKALAAKAERAAGITSFEEITKELSDFNLEMPIDQSDEYNKVIAMFEKSVGDYLELSVQEFRMYFLDEWPWRQVAMIRNASFTRAAKDCDIGDADMLKALGY